MRIIVEHKTPMIGESPTETDSLIIGFYGCIAVIYRVIFYFNKEIQDEKIKLNLITYSTFKLHIKDIFANTKTKYELSTEN